MERLANFQKSGSNWIFNSVVSLDIHTVKYKPLKVSSHIPLPEALKDKTTITLTLIECQSAERAEDSHDNYMWRLQTAFYAPPLIIGGASDSFV